MSWEVLKKERCGKTPDRYVASNKVKSAWFTVVMTSWVFFSRLQRWIALNHKNTEYLPCPVLSHQWSGACHRPCRTGQHDSHFIGQSHCSDIVWAPAHDWWVAQISCYCPGARDKSPFCLFILEFFCHTRLSQHSACCCSKAEKLL